jgi:hypothetical protein
MDRRLSILAVLAASACATTASYRTLERAPERIANVEATVYLVGDAGLDTDGRDAVLAQLHADLRRHVEEHPTVPALVAFLGDNIYEVGARADRRSEDLAKLSVQVDAVVAAPGVRGVFLPGNHDWAKGAPDSLGRSAIEVQQGWLQDIRGSRDVSFLPADECPGPQTVGVGGDVSVVFIDTEWLLRQPEDCGGADLFYRRLTRVLERLAGDRVILAAHHPRATGGPHGGNVGLFDHGPVIYYLGAKAGLGVQDLASGRYSEMLRRLRAAIAASGHRPLVMAAGHDHSLQVIGLQRPDEPLYQLVSGSASKTSPVERIEGTRYATSSHGYMRLDFTPDRARLVVHAIGSRALDALGDGGSDGAGDGGATERAGVEPVFACMLDSEAGGGCPEAPLRDPAR